MSLDRRVNGAAVGVASAATAVYTPAIPSLAIRHPKEGDPTECICVSCYL